MNLDFTLPIGEMRCAVCGAAPQEGKELTVVLYAGSAWEDGHAVLEDGAELYTAKMFCIEHAPSPGEAERVA